MTTSAPSSVNGFNVVRILAAMAVVLDHSFMLTGRDTLTVATWSDRSMDLGGLAVLTFFGISGYLIASSWLGEPRLVPFLRKRVLRIWPALLVLLALTVFVLGPVVSTLSTGEYFAAPGTWEYLRTATLAPVELHLPGVFEDNPQDKVNASLWTLPIELCCYGILAVIATLGALRRSVLLPLAVLLVVLAEAVLADFPRDVTLLLTAFVWGSVLRLSPGLLRRGTALAVAALVGGFLVPGAAAVTSLAWVYLVIRACRLPMSQMQWLVGRGDPSYGIYIYGAPVQQALILLGLTTPMPLFAASAVLVPVLGYTSWHLVEKRALRLVRPRPRVDASTDQHARLRAGLASVS